MATILNREDMRRRLHARRSSLLARYRGLLERADDAAIAHEPDVLDRAEDEWDARVLSIMSCADELALESVIAALDRLDHGGYGTCTACCTAIDPDRLRSVPDAALCVDCATAAEDLPARWTYASERA